MKFLIIAIAAIGTTLAMDKSDNGIAITEGSPQSFYEDLIKQFDKETQQNAYYTCLFYQSTFATQRVLKKQLSDMEKVEIQFFRSLSENARFCLYAMRNGLYNSGTSIDEKIRLLTQLRFIMEKDGFVNDVQDGPCAKQRSLSDTHLVVSSLSKE